MSPIDFHSPAAGFDEPLELWLACHQRVQRMTRLLARLAPHLAQHGADAQARDAAASVRRYFDEAAPRHHDDEEIDLFPLLRERAAAGGDAATVARLGEALRTLQAEHESLGALWRELRAPLVQIEAGQAAVLDPEGVARFAEGYAAHIALEEGVIAPALRELLTTADRQAVGRAMAQRRGADGSPRVG